MLATTKVRIERPEGSGDPYEAATSTIVGIYAVHVSTPSAADLRVGGAQETIDAVLYASWICRPERGDIVTDVVTGDTWVVRWVQRRTGLGLDHVTAGLSRTAGAANG